jgi:TrmH family RNA methyltransferase
VKLLATARDLQRRRSRERRRDFVVEGVRSVEELLRSRLTIRGVIVAPSLAAHERGVALRTAIETTGVPTLEVSDRELEDAAATESPQGVLAVARIPEHDPASLTLADRARILVLDGVQDPGNVGTLVRTAAAFGVAATVAMPGTVDFWNGKVVRSSMGALFSHPTATLAWTELDAFLAAGAIPLWGAAAGGVALESIDRARVRRLAIVVGNEGAGLSPDALRRVERSVAIRIDPAVESLNVAVAAGILLHHFQS